MTQGPHLSESDLAAFLDGQLDPAARQLAVTHLESCDDCRAELVDSRSLATGYRRRMSSRTGLRWWLPVGGAIAAGLAGLVLFRGLTGPQSPREKVRTPVVGSTEAAARILTVAPRDGAAVTPVGLQFTWRAYNADTYRFVLLEEDGTPAWSSDTHDTSLVLPAEIILAAGKTYFWRVDALADGIAASTGTLRVQVPR